MARRAFFFGRFEASQFGSDSIEIDHIALGLLQADMHLSIRLFKTQERVNEIRARIGRAIPCKQPPGPASEKLPLSQSCTRVMSFAAAEAQHLDDKLITPERLLRSILRENSSIAAGILLESITIAQLKKEEVKKAEMRVTSSFSKEIESVGDFVVEARLGQAMPLTRRKRELDQLLQILSRRTKNSALLIGEPGVGKDSLVKGLALRIAGGNVPQDPADRPILWWRTSRDCIPLSRNSWILAVAAALFSTCPACWICAKVCRPWPYSQTRQAATHRHRYAARIAVGGRSER